jgi:phosphoribosylformimino-5-aminoimidazole carboxamide ribotide isomerase
VSISSQEQEVDLQDSITMIEKYCSELLIHAADVEGLCQGVDEELVRKLGEWVTLPCTYAGGARGELNHSFSGGELMSRNIRFGISR